MHVDHLPPLMSLIHAVKELIEQVGDTKTWRVVAKNTKSKHG
jgi:hypothetical protein